VRKYLCMIIVPAGLSGCGIAPDLPNEAEMPVQDILTHAVCELRESFGYFKNNGASYPNFKADEWAISITLDPKVDTDLSLKFGMLGKSTIRPAPVHYATWTLGSTPGVEFDSKGHREGSVAFPLTSAKLLELKNPKDPTSGYKYPLVCSDDHVLEFNLTRHLGIQEWLERVIPQGYAGAIATLDKPTYTTELITKFDAGAAGPTFYARYLTYNGSAYGSWTADVILTVLLTPQPKQVAVKTLPEGTPIAKSAAAPLKHAVSEDSLQRLDQIQTETLLRNLRVTP